MKPVAICSNERIFKHSTSWVYEWIHQCEAKGIPFEVVNCYRYDIIAHLQDYSVLLWHYSHYVLPDIMEAQNILNIAASLGLRVFPDNNTGWHFDDKVAEMYALQSINAPIPDSWVFYDKKDCLSWLENEAQYPIVAKLKSGSGSNNVKLLHNVKKAKSYANQMFSSGFKPVPSIMYKAYSKTQSAEDLKMFIARAKRIPEFLLTRKCARKMPRERGYCYFQQFIPNNGYDLKIVVVRDKMSFLARHTRKGDFRASGSGSIYYEKALVTDEIRESAFAVADKLKLQCIGLDYVVNNLTGRGLIVEMCYGFDWQAQYDLGGYWDRVGNWHNEPLNVPAEVLNNLVS